MYGELPEIETTGGQKVHGWPVKILNPEKVAVLRLPANDELLAYLTAQRSLYRDLGRRQGESEEVPTPAADLKLFTAIRIDKDGEPFDEAEALYAIGILTRWKVNSCERDGATFVVKIGTVFGETTHVVNIPFQKDLAEYRRFVYKSRDIGNGLEERRFPPEVPVKLYDKIVEYVEGYIGTQMGSGPEFKQAIPPHHKRAVVMEVVQALSLLDPSLDPNS
jgi:hypothetical protein